MDWELGHAKPRSREGAEVGLLLGVILRMMELWCASRGRARSREVDVG